jgi:hypothetical protein
MKFLSFFFFLLFNFFYVDYPQEKNIMCVRDLESMLPEDFDSTDSVVSDYI